MTALAHLARKIALRERENFAMDGFSDEAAVYLAMLKAGFTRKPKTGPADYARRFAREKLLLQGTIVSPSPCGGGARNRSAAASRSAAATRMPASRARSMAYRVIGSGGRARRSSRQYPAISARPSARRGSPCRTISRTRARPRRPRINRCAGGFVMVVIAQQKTRGTPGENG
jgi:hypothetical protein